MEVAPIAAPTVGHLLSVGIKIFEPPPLFQPKMKNYIYNISERVKECV
jgi:hypothetical protein